jgi:hypothetical protein
MKQMASNSKEQFTNSADLDKALVDAIIDAFEPHQAMGSQALGSAKVQAAPKDTLLGPVPVYEALRARSGTGWTSPLPHARWQSDATTVVDLMRIHCLSTFRHAEGRHAASCRAVFSVCWSYDCSKA